MRRRIVFAVAYVLLLSSVSQASTPRCDVARAELKTLESVLELYLVAHERHPDQRSWLAQLKADGLLPASEDGLDPWGRAYVYEPRGADYLLFSLGPDGKRNTEDDQTRANDFRWKVCARSFGCSL